MANFYSYHSTFCLHVESKWIRDSNAGRWVLQIWKVLSKKYFQPKFSFLSLVNFIATWKANEKIKLPEILRTS